MMSQRQTWALFLASRLRSHGFKGRRLPSAFARRLIRCTTDYLRIAALMGFLTLGLRLSTMGHSAHASHSSRWSRINFLE
jgi:hypothetical protein